MSTADDVSTTSIDDNDESIMKMSDFQIGVAHNYLFLFMSTFSSKRKETKPF